MKMAAFHVVVRGMNHRSLGADFRAAKRLGESLNSVHRSPTGRITSDYADMAMAQTKQVSRGALGRSCIVDANPSDIGVTPRWVTVRVDNRKIPQNQSCFCPRGIYGRNPDNTVHSPTVKRVQIIPLLLPIVAGISYQHSVIRRGGVILGSANQFDVKVV